MGTDTSELLVVADPTSLAGEAAVRFAAAATAATARAGRFTVALAGGSTPRRLYEMLAAEPYGHRLPWGRTHVFWGDERAVPPDHPEANFGMAQNALLRRVAIPAGHVHRMAGESADLDAAARRYEQEIAEAFGVTAGDAPPAFDLLLLGLGPDGHTASLFPQTEALREGRCWVVRNPVPKLRTDRLTLTPPILNRARTILFLVAGADKAPALQAVLEGPADPVRLPAQLIRPPAGRVVWIVDRAAAGLLRRREVTP